jgi:hypothetical protein
MSGISGTGTQMQRLIVNFELDGEIYADSNLFQIDSE